MVFSNLAFAKEHRNVFFQRLLLSFNDEDNQIPPPSLSLWNAFSFTPVIFLHTHTFVLHMSTNTIQFIQYAPLPPQKGGKPTSTVNPPKANSFFSLNSLLKVVHGLMALH